MDETGSPVHQTMYRGIIGSLLYLIANRPDIVFSVGLCARFQSNPKESHLKAAKRILRYLKGTQDLVRYYPSSNSFNLIGYVDVDYAGYLVDRKSTSGMAHFLGSCLISWGTRKQNPVAISTAEAEYVAVASCRAQLLWIKQQLEDFGVVPIEKENDVTVFVVSANGVLHEIISRKNKVQGVGDERAIVTIEGDALADTTRPSHEEPDPSPEDPAQGFHS
ncbi:secreted RxLR effector protein 161-like [Nicotiana sylvestris]|uniref:secreted RxLR effector protein 161-like n=1 Tax=Nicotiana sylvestris TaxID=4096 RepID=UPI00388C4450